MAADGKNNTLTTRSSLELALCRCGDVEEFLSLADEFEITNKTTFFLKLGFRGVQDAFQGGVAVSEVGFSSHFALLSTGAADVRDDKWRDIPPEMKK